MTRGILALACLAAGSSMAGTASAASALPVVSVDTPVLVKVVNESGGRQRLRIGSSQSGPVYAGVAKLSMERQRQEHLRKEDLEQPR